MFQQMQAFAQKQVINAIISQFSCLFLILLYTTLHPFLFFSVLLFSLKNLIIFNFYLKIYKKKKNYQELFSVQFCALQFTSSICI